MKPIRFACAAGLFVLGGAQAQMPDQAAAPTLQADKPVAAFGKALQPFPRAYLNDENAPAIGKLHPNFRTDPKLVGGIDLTPNLGIETGFSNLFSRGFHYMDEAHGDERAGSLGNRGFASYLAAKITVPVDERFSAYGKLGMAYSVRAATEKAVTQRAADAGAYASVGAKYKLSDKAALIGEYQMQGDAADKWKNGTNATGISAKLKIGF